jgi:signal transduction histidine kinase
VSRLSIRARLTGAFALAMIVVLAGAGLFVYLRFSADLDEAVNASLAGRADAAAALVSSSGQTLAGPAPGPLEDPEESFVEVLSADARVLDATGLLGPREVREATREGLLVERSVPGIEGTTRVLARPLSAAPGSAVLVVGQSLDDRSEALAGLVASLAIGGSVAVALASIVGYLLAAAGLAPVEAMRRRAREVSLTRDDEWLPLPAARDEVRRLAETLNEMLDRLRRSFARERRFVADASHELRTPVAVGEVLSTREMAETPLAQFDNALLTRDTITIEPSVLEYKLYAPRVGPVLVVGVSGGPGSREELVELDNASQEWTRKAGTAPLGEGPTS